MLVYHGTTLHRARRIAREGFAPLPPSRRVWFAEDRLYAYHRARTQARRADDKPVVLTCEVDLEALRETVGRRRVKHMRRVIAVDGPVSADVLRWRPDVDLPATPDELAEWLSDILALEGERRVRPDHPGVRRLARWLDHRLAGDPRGELRWSEVLGVAKRWLPEFFVNVPVDRRRVAAHARVGSIHVEVDAAKAKRDERAFTRARALLASSQARQRVRGLRMLAEIRPDDLFDWCVLFLDDGSVLVRRAALDAMLQCEDILTDVVEPLAGHERDTIRAGAMAALARHGGADAARWFARGLKDPASCVRLATVRVLEQVCPDERSDLFALALTDPNPHVVRAARKLARGRDLAPLKW
jgi:hypothetical protein